MDFFSDCITQEQVKVRYRDLVKHFHPDKGGKPEFMIELQKQYEGWDKKDKSEPYQFNKIKQPYDHTANYHDPYRDVPFDHPLRKELFNLRNQLAGYKDHGSARFYGNDMGTLNKITRDFDARLYKAQQETKEKQEEIDRLKKDLAEMDGIAIKLLKGIDDLPFFKKLGCLFFGMELDRQP